MVSKEVKLAVSIMIVFVCLNTLIGVSLIGTHGDRSNVVQNENYTFNEADGWISYPVKEVFWGSGVSKWTSATYESSENGHIFIYGNDSKNGGMSFVEIRFNVTMDNADDLVGVYVNVLNWDTYILDGFPLAFWCGWGARSLCSKNYFGEKPMIDTELFLMWSNKNFTSWVEEFPDKNLWVVISVADITVDADIQVLWMNLL